MNYGEREDPGLILAVQVSRKPDRPRTTSTRSFNNLPYRFHNVGDDRIVYIDSSRQVFHQRHHLTANNRRTS